MVHSFVTDCEGMCKLFDSPDFSNINIGSFFFGTIIIHSGFDPSDWPIWTDFAGGNFRLHALFFGKSYRENKNCSGSENTQKKL